MVADILHFKSHSAVHPSFKILGHEIGKLSPTLRPLTFAQSSTSHFQPSSLLCLGQQYLSVMFCRLSD